MPLASRKFETEEQPTECQNTGFGGSPDGGQPTLRRSEETPAADEPQSLLNSNHSYSTPDEDRTFSYGRPDASAEAPQELGTKVAVSIDYIAPPAAPEVLSPTAAQIQTIRNTKSEKVAAQDFELLRRDDWLVRNGHLVTYVALYVFSLVILFRPYEILPGFGWLAFSAFYLGVATLIIFFPSQLAVEGNLTQTSVEVKALLTMTAIAFVLIPIAKDPWTAWDTFNDPFIKAIVIFVVLVNVVRTRKRLMQMMWLSLGIGVYLSACAVEYYMEGKFSVEAYRVAITGIKGIFGNPNEMALHFVMMTPITLCLAIAEKRKTWKVVYFAATALFVAANMVTYSRGGFLGLIAVAATLAWKLGRKNRMNTIIGACVALVATFAASPGNYGLRMISIFIPSLDPNGSSDARRELLQRSLLVTARNPWGIGIGNFPIVATQNHQTHNAFTQVSSELGLLGLVVYVIFMVAPFRRLRAIERRQFEANDLNWFYYLSIGLQASIVGYWMSSFFASVAYNWFIYYLIAYAVAFRRIYALENKDNLEREVDRLSIPSPVTA